jgi:hypothetical protein
METLGLEALEGSPIVIRILASRRCWHSHEHAKAERLVGF